MLPLIAAGLSALPGLYKGITGLIGQSEYGKMKRPDFEIPKGVTDAENTYKYLAGQDMPGSAAYEQKILGNQESLLNRLENNTESGAALLGAAPNMVAKTNENLSDLTTQGAEFRNKNAANLANFQGNNVANWQAKKWEFEKAQPYLNDMEAAQKSNLNLYEGMSDAIGGAVKGYSGATLLQNQKDNMDAQSKSFENWINSFGKDKPTDVTNSSFGSPISSSFSTIQPNFNSNNAQKGWIKIGGKWKFIG